MELGEIMRVEEDEDEETDEAMTRQRVDEEYLPISIGSSIPKPPNASKSPRRRRNKKNNNKMSLKNFYAWEECNHEMCRCGVQAEEAGNNEETGGHQGSSERKEGCYQGRMVEDDDTDDEMPEHVDSSSDEGMRRPTETDEDTDSDDDEDLDEVLKL